MPVRLRSETDKKGNRSPCRTATLASVYLVRTHIPAILRIRGVQSVPVYRPPRRELPTDLLVRLEEPQDGSGMVEDLSFVQNMGEVLRMHMQQRCFKTDGNEYPTQTAWGKGNMVIKKADPYHWTSVVTLEGGNKITSKVVTSKDGKTRTHTSTGTNTKGEKINTVTVWERQ